MRFKHRKRVRKKRLQTRQDRILTLSNAISISRIFLAIPLVLLFEDSYFKTLPNDEYRGTFVSTQNISTKIELGTHITIWKTLCYFFLQENGFFFKKNDFREHISFNLIEIQAAVLYFHHELVLKFRKK